ncbi:MAG: ATPase domain-containing protein [Dehalococcoidia bacterium]
MTVRSGLRNLDRVTTGVDSLDDILEGGIPQYSIVFVAGLPGTGKTILCEQALFANARHGTCLYMSTLSEPVMKMLRFGQRFEFFDSTALGHDVIYSDLGASIRRGGADGFLAELERLVQEHRPSFIVIDSFKVLREEFDEDRAFRKFAADLMAMLSTWEVTSFLVGEYSERDIRERPEFAIADGIIHLYGTEESLRQKRYLRIMKMRGTSVFSGEHYFDISTNGVTVYPRMNPEVVGEYAIPEGRIGSAVIGLADMMSGGVERSTVTIITGRTGSGKTIVALSMLVSAARAGLPALLLTLEESPAQISRNFRSFGWEVDSLREHGLLDVLHVSPSEVDLDAHAVLLKERAERIQAKVVVIDSITSFQAAVPDEQKYTGYLWAIADYFKRSGVAVLMTNELTSGDSFVERKVSFVADNIVSLAFSQRGAERIRTVSVLKTRGSPHENVARELLIAQDKVSVGEPVTLNGSYVG